MSNSPESLFISRTFLPREHNELRSHMNEFNRSMPDITLQWRHLGQVGVMLVQSGEYTKLTQQPRSRLRSRAVREVAKELNEGLHASSEQTTVSLQAAAFLGHNTANYVHVGFKIEPGELLSEREELIAKLDKLNKAPGDWRHEFQPYLSIATLSRTETEADAGVLEAFREIMPEMVTLYGAKAQIG